MAKLGLVRPGSQPGNSQSWVLPGLLLLFLLPLLGYAGYSVADRWYQGYQLSREEAALRGDITRLREENLRLQAELKDVRSDAFIEGVAREQLGLVKPGDNALVLLAPGGPRAATPRAPLPPPAPADAATWRRWWNLFFGDRAEP